MTPPSTTSGEEVSPSSTSQRRLLSVAALGTCFVVLRLAAVTHFDLGDSFRILPALNFGQLINIVLGWALAHPGVVGAAAAAFAALAAAYVPLRLSDALSRHLTDLLVAIAFAVLAIRIGGVPAYATLILGMAYVLSLKILQARRSKSDSLVEGMLALYSLLTLALMVTLTILAAIDDTPWVPREPIASISYTGPGYAFGTYADQLVVMTESRDVLYLPKRSFTGNP
jgi:hypothetical protein